MPRERPARRREENPVEFSRIVAFSDGSSRSRSRCGDTAAVVLYAANLAGVVLVGMLMFSDARRAGLLQVSEEEANEFRHRSIVISAVFLASIPVALIDGHAAQFIWLVLFFAPLLVRARGDTVRIPG